MTKDELLQLIEKAKNLSLRYEPENEEKSRAFERFAEFLEEPSNYTHLSDFDHEIELWDCFLEAEGEVNNYWDVAFPEGDEDDSITDYFTKD